MEWHIFCLLKSSNKENGDAKSDFLKFFDV